MVDTPEQAEARRKARERVARFERENSTPAAFAERAERQARVRKEQADARIDAALAGTRALAAKGELTPEQMARRKLLHDKWATKHDGPGHGMSNEEFQEMQLLDAIHARKPPPAPVKPAPRPAARDGRKAMSSLTSAVTAKVSDEITALRRERESYQHERELQAQKIETALARLDAVIARVEASGGADKGRDSQQSRFILTRDVG